MVASRQKPPFRLSELQGTHYSQPLLTKYVIEKQSVHALWRNEQRPRAALGWKTLHYEIIFVSTKTPDPHFGARLLDRHATFDLSSNLTQADRPIQAWIHRICIKTHAAFDLEPAEDTKELLIPRSMQH